MRLLRANELGSDYEQAWDEWIDTGERDAWMRAVGDSVTEAS
jgi:hypothetical protein